MTDQSVGVEMEKQKHCSGQLWTTVDVLKTCRGLAVLAVGMKGEVNVIVGLFDSWIP